MESEVKPPRPDEPQSPHPQQQAHGGGDPGQNVPPPTVVVPMSPQGPQPPTADDEARKRRTERRDRWRLGVEVGALFVGAAGFIGLLLALEATREANRIASEDNERTREMVRAYLVPDRQEGKASKPVVLPRPDGDGFRIRLRNIGQTPVKGYTVEAWLMRGSSGVSIEPPPSDVPQRIVLPNHTVYGELLWYDGAAELNDMSGSEDQIVGTLWRITYKDISGLTHCEEFAVNSLTPPTWAVSFEDFVRDFFVETDAPPVCTKETRGVSLTRICLPPTTLGGPAIWGTRWEWSPKSGPRFPSPEDDLTPCRSQEQENSQ